jgi:hypothetical protein
MPWLKNGYYAHGPRVIDVKAIVGIKSGLDQDSGVNEIPFT